jgi:hypothetical protein
VKDWSEYTLVSFGDSFTFGQDTVHHDFPQMNDNDLKAKNKVWKSQCNKKSYTQVICNRMGFKDNLNFGIPGCSNERSLMLLESFLRQNPKKKVFVLFNFTSTSRFMNMFKYREDKYSLVDITPERASSEPTPSNQSGVTKKSMENYYTYFRNKMQEVYCHIRDRRMLLQLVSMYNVPHTTFDVLNDMDSRILRDNPSQYIHSSASDCGSLYNNDENYVFDEMEYFDSYYKELIDNSSPISHIGIDYLSNLPPGSINVMQYIGRTGIHKHNDYHAYTVGGVPGGHWTREGHIEVAELVEKYINENYN